MPHSNAVAIPESRRQKVRSKEFFESVTELLTTHISEGCTQEQAEAKVLYFISWTLAGEPSPEEMSGDALIKFYMDHADECAEALNFLNGYAATLMASARVPEKGPIQ